MTSTDDQETVLIRHKRALVPREYRPDEAEGPSSGQIAYCCVNASSCLGVFENIPEKYEC